MAKFKAGVLDSILKDFDIKSQAKVEKGIKIAVIGTWGAIIQQTPARTGRARGNWFLTTGKPSKKATNYKNKNKGSNYIANNLGNVIKQKHYLTNNLPYIKTLEYGGRGRKANRMVRDNIKHWKQRLKAAFKGLA